MVRLGLTGSIGSGKSTISRIFATFGIPIYEADATSKRILAQDDIRKNITELFPEILSDPLFSPDSFYSFTKALGRIVFSDSEKLITLNKLLHPLVTKDCLDWISSNSDSSYVVIEAAILIESGMYKIVDKILDIETTEALQIKRTMLRDNCTEEEVKKRLSMQLSSKERMGLSDFVIYNDEKHSVLEEVLYIDSLLKAIESK